MKRSGFFAFIVILLIGAAFAYQAAGTKEPRYQGRTLTQWLNERPNTQNTFLTRPLTLSSEAHRAVMAIGSNSIPMLLQMMQAKDSAAKCWVNSLLDRQRIIALRFHTAAQWRTMAALGFEALGESGRSAAPALASLTKDPRVEIRYAALESLRRIKPNPEIALPVLLRMCHDSAPEIRFVAEVDLHFRSPESLKAAGIPDFLEELSKQAADRASASVP